MEIKRNNIYRREPSPEELAAYRARRAEAHRKCDKPQIIIYRDRASSPSYTEYSSPRLYVTAQAETHPLALPVDCPIIFDALRELGFDPQNCDGHQNTVSESTEVNQPTIP